MFDVGVDCDGVLHDFVQSLRRYVVDQELFLDGCYAALHTRPWNLEEDKRVRVNSMSVIQSGSKKVIS